MDSRIDEDKFFELAGHLDSFEQYVGVPGFNLIKADKDDLKDCAVMRKVDLLKVDRGSTFSCQKWTPGPLLVTKNVPMGLLLVTKIGPSVPKLDP